jgi:hypothetical protein
LSLGETGIGKELIARAIHDRSPRKAEQLSESFLSHLSVIDEESEYPMDDHKLFSDSTFEEQAHLAERELSSFVRAVTELYGPRQAGLSAKDWLDESDSMDIPPFSTERNWRAVTIAASARLAKRLSLGLDQTNLAAS